MKRILRKIKNVVLETTTIIAFGAMCFSMCCLDSYSPVIMAVLIASLTWLGLFCLANGVFES